VTVAFYIPKF